MHIRRFTNKIKRLIFPHYIQEFKVKESRVKTTQRLCCLHIIQYTSEKVYFSFSYLRSIHVLESKQIFCSIMYDRLRDNKPCIRAHPTPTKCNVLICTSLYSLRIDALKFGINNSVPLATRFVLMLMCLCELYFILCFADNVILVV